MKYMTNAYFSFIGIYMVISTPKHSLCPSVGEHATMVATPTTNKQISWSSDGYLQLDAMPACRTSQCCFASPV